MHICMQIRKDLQWINDFANRLGDDRAAKAKAKWTRPVKPIVSPDQG